jgi:hypothetical protein
MLCKIGIQPPREILGYFVLKKTCLFIWSRIVGEGGGGEQGGEMAQTMYAYVNKLIIFKN